MSSGKYIGRDHPHAAVTSCFSRFFERCVSTSGDILFEKLDEGLTRLFNLKIFWPALGELNEMYESYFLFGYWEGNFQDSCESVTNSVPEFVKGSKYVAYVTSSEWGGLDDDTPYDFPAVAYSPAELRAWFVYTFIEFMHSHPNHKNRLMELMECHVDVQEALQLMQRKLNGEPWDFGPARRYESKIILWYERVKNKEMNDLIRTYIDNAHIIVPKSS